MRRSWTRILTTAVALLAPELTVAQSSPEASFGEYLEVQLVTVELFATARGGVAITDLSLEEIQVFEDERPVEVTHFRAPALAATVEGRPLPTTADSARPGASQALETPLRLVIFVDNLNTGPASRARLLDQLWEVVDSGLRPSDEVMVVSFDGSLDIQMEFSRNRKELRRTLEYVTTIVGNRLMAGLSDRNALEDIQLDQDHNADGPCVFVGQLARQHSDTVNQRVQATLSALEQFVGSLAGIPGRKVLLHVSDGIPLVPGAEAWNHAMTLCDGSGGVVGVPGATVADQYDGAANRFDPKTAMLDMQSYDTSRQWQRLAALASTHRVVIYPLFAPGLQAPVNSETDVVQTSPRNQAEAIANKQGALSIMAIETGGEATFNTNDFRPAVQAAIDESLTSYELAYVSPAAGDGQVHAIRIEVDRPDVRLRYRQSYQAKSPQQRVQEGVLSALFYGLVDNPLAAKVHVARTSDRIVDGKTPVEVRISLPLDQLTLLPKTDHQAGLFTVFVAIRDSSGRTSSIGRRTIPIQVPDQQVAASGRSYEYIVGMEVGIESTTIAVALRDEVGGTTSYLTARVDPSG